MKVEAAASDPAAPNRPVPDWYHDAVLYDMALDFLSFPDSDEDSEDDFEETSSASQVHEGTSVVPSTTNLPTRNRLPAAGTINVDESDSAPIQEKLPGGKQH